MVDFKRGASMLLFACLFTFPLKAQNNCTVNMKTIADSYDGECKKGLADGEGEAKGVDSYIGHFSKGLPNGLGRYEWANGDYYDGEWRRGERTGDGSFYQALSDSLTVGRWKKGKYSGELRPKITHKHSSGNNPWSQSISKTMDGHNKIKIVFKFEKNRITSATTSVQSHPYVSGVKIEYSSGDQESTVEDNTVLLSQVDFPFTGKIDFRYGVAGESKDYMVEYSIPNPGFWELRITL